MRATEVIRVLTNDGWHPHSSNGSHQQFKHSVKKGKVTVPVHSGDLDIFVLKNIAKQAGIDFGLFRRG